MNKKSFEKFISDNTKLFGDGRYFVVKLHDNKKIIIGRKIGDTFTKIAEADNETYAKQLLKTVKSLNGDNILVKFKNDKFYMFDIQSKKLFGESKSVEDAEKFIHDIYYKYYSGSNAKSNLEKFINGSNKIIERNKIKPKTIVIKQIKLNNLKFNDKSS